MKGARINRYAGTKLNDVLSKLARGWMDSNAREYFNARREVLSKLPTCY